MAKEPVRIVVVGSANTDFVVTAPRLPERGETVLGGAFATVRGGKGANQAVAAARLGADVTFVARLGADRLGDEAAAAYAAEGIDTSYVTRDPSAASGVALIITEADGENVIAVAPGANARLLPEHVEAAEPAIERANAVLVQLEIPLPAVAAAVRIARRHDRRVILNPAPAAELPAEVLRGADVITPNRRELAFYAGERVRIDDLMDAAQHWRAVHGIRAVVVTLGRAGAFIAEESGSTLVSGFPVEAVDTTGAGDAFNAGLAVAWGRGAGLAEAVRYANAVGALKATRAGAQSSPWADEVAELLAR